MQNPKAYTILESGYYLSKADIKVGKNLIHPPPDLRKAAIKLTNSCKAHHSRRKIITENPLLSSLFIYLIDTLFEVNFTPTYQIIDND